MDGGKQSFILERHRRAHWQNELDRSFIDYKSIVWLCLLGGCQTENRAKRRKHSALGKVKDCVNIGIGSETRNIYA